MSIVNLFQDALLVSKIQAKLPSLFQLAELESSRAGKIGMEVGSVREKILIALLIYKYGKSNIETDPITTTEVDVRVFGNPLSIKTITGKKARGVKMIWTVDAEQALKFRDNYVPTCDMLLAQINWGGTGALFLFPQSTQSDVLDDIKREGYLKLPKQGTNPRGVELSANALDRLIEHPNNCQIPIKWTKSTIEYDIYHRWLDLWEKD